MSCALCPTTERAGTDLITCWRCRDRIANQLDPEHVGDRDRNDPASIPRLYALITPTKDAPMEQSERSVSGLHAAVPLDVHAASLRDPRSKANGLPWQDRSERWVWEPGAGRALLHAGSVLDGWSREVSRLRDVERADRPDRRPMDQDHIGPMTWAEHSRAVRPYSPRLGDTARFLLRHLDWCCGQDWIPDMVAELVQLHIQLRRATAHATGEKLPVWIGRCAQPQPGTEPDYSIDPHVDPLQGRPRCNHPLHSPWYGDIVTCAGCGSWWAPRNYLDLGRHLVAAS